MLSLGSSLSPLGDTSLEDNLDEPVAHNGGSDELMQEQDVAEALGVARSAQILTVDTQQVQAV